MMHQSIPLSEERTNLIIGALLCLMPLLGMAVDLVAPSLPAIAAGLHISRGIAQNVITLYLLGYALGSFFSGFLADALGRKHLLRAGLLGFAVISLMPVVFPNITVLLVVRFFQGITIGLVSVVGRTIFADILPPEKLVRIGTLTGSMFGIGTVIGPLIGGYLQVYGGWEACFIFFAAIAMILFIALVLILPETHFQRHPLRIKTIQRHFLEVIHHQHFMALVFIMGLVYSLIVAFNTAGPFLIQTKLHHTPIFFGHIALFLGGSFLTSTFVCRYCIKKYKVEELLFATIHLFFFVALVSLLASFFFNTSMALLMGTSLVMFFSTGFIFPMCMGKGMSLFRHIAGMATATMYLINISMTSLTAFLLSFMNVQNITSMIAVYALLLSLCVIIYWRSVNTKRKKQTVTL